LPAKSLSNWLSVTAISIPQGNGMPNTSCNPFDSTAMLDGIRRWVEIETPTEAPGRINELATLVAEGHRVHYEQLYVSSIEPRARLIHRLYQTLR
jgi:hypothetical protein